MSSAFLDSNILIYAFSDDKRRTRAEALVHSGCAISVQCLNEFASVARRKLNVGWDEVLGALVTIQGLCPTIVPVTVDLHEHGLQLAKRHGFSIYDAMIVAGAFVAGCDTLWSEDMHDGLTIDGRLTIRNPFA